MDFSFNYGTTQAPSTKTTGGVVRQSTPAQQEYYLSLCSQKRLEPMEGFQGFTFDELSVEIDKIKFYFPPSLSQLEMIDKKLTVLREVGVEVAIPEGLTGGFQGTASVFIGELIALEKEYVVLPPSDNQLMFLVKMYLCPDCDFESYGVMRRIELGDGTFRKPTANEFAEMIKQAFSKDMASEFLNKFKVEFNSWTRTRIRPGQFAYMKTLYERLGQQVDESTMLQFSVEEAGIVIDGLLKASKETYKPEIIINREIKVAPKNAEEARVQGEEDLEKLLYKIIAETGEEPVDGVDELLAHPELVKDYVIFLLENGLMENDTVKAYCEDCEELREAFAC